MDSTIRPYLLVQELPGILFNVALIQVCCQTHETNFRKTEVSELDVPHGCDQEAGEPEKQKDRLFLGFPRVSTLVSAKFSHSGFCGVIAGCKLGRCSRETGSYFKYLPFVHSPSSLLPIEYSPPQLCSPLGAASSQLRKQIFFHRGTCLLRRQ